MADMCIMNQAITQAAVKATEASVQAVTVAGAGRNIKVQE